MSPSTKSSILRMSPVSLISLIFILMTFHRESTYQADAGKHLIRQTVRDNHSIESLRNIVTHGDPCRRLNRQTAAINARERIDADSTCILAMHGYNGLPPYARKRCRNARQAACKQVFGQDQWNCGFKVDLVQGWGCFGVKAEGTALLSVCIENLDLFPPTY